MSTVNEQIVTGRTHRVLLDKAAKLWQRISFWTKASDVEFNNGTSLEVLISNLTASGAIAKVELVDALPSDASSHPTTFYLVKG